MRMTWISCIIMKLYKNNDRIDLILLYSVALSPAKRIIDAMEHGDYPTAMTLWDHYILRGSDLPGFKRLLYIETLMNLYMATYPFRSDIVHLAGSARNAAAVAARAMGVFRNYVESRKDIMMKYNVVLFIKTCQIHSIAFPPTHPKYKYIFEDDWLIKAKTQIDDFLRKRIPECTIGDIPGVVSDGVHLISTDVRLPPI